MSSYNIQPTLGAEGITKYYDAYCQYVGIFDGLDQRHADTTLDEHDATSDLNDLNDTGEVRVVLSDEGLQHHAARLLAILDSMDTGRLLRVGLEDVSLVISFADEDLLN